MRYFANAVYPLLLAAADLLVGGLLFREVSVGLGLAVAAFGVLVLCSAASRTLYAHLPPVGRPWRRSVARALRSR